MSVTPLVLQVYFWNHTGSLDNAKMDGLSEIMIYNSDFSIDLPSGFVNQSVISPLADLYIHWSMTTIKPSASKMYLIFRLIMVVGSLLSMVTTYRQGTFFLVTEQMKIHSCFNGLFRAEMRCRQHQNVVISREMQSHIRDKSRTNIDYWSPLDGIDWYQATLSPTTPYGLGANATWHSYVLSCTAYSLFNIW